jgi:hypothetical protein
MSGPLGSHCTTATCATRSAIQSGCKSFHSSDRSVHGRVWLQPMDSRWGVNAASASGATDGLAGFCDQVGGAAACDGRERRIPPNRRSAGRGAPRERGAAVCTASEWTSVPSGAGPTSTQKHADTCAHAALMDKRVHTRTPAHAHKRTSAYAHKHTRACTQTHTHERAHVRRLRGPTRRHQRVWRKPDAVLVRFGREGKRPTFVAMWRVKRPAHVLAHVCATARTMDRRMRCNAAGSRPSAVLFERGAHRLLGIRRQSIHPKSRQSLPIAFEMLRC